jgi:addiction module RelE/StbE family toxin
MKIILHRNFEKRYKKLNPKIQTKFKGRKNLFVTEQFHPLLNNHKLTGKYEGCSSFNITGDWRVVFEMIDEETAYFITIDTHSNLYK